MAQVSEVAQGAEAIRQSTTWSAISLYRMSGVSQATEGWPKKGLCRGTDVTDIKPQKQAPVQQVQGDLMFAEHWEKGKMLDSEARSQRAGTGVWWWWSGWRGGSAVKSTECSSEGPEFKFQQLHGGSQPSVMRSNVLFWGV